MAQEVKQRVTAWHICQARLPSLPPQSLFMATLVASFPMQHLFVDLFDLEGTTYLVMVDRGRILPPLDVGMKVSIQDTTTKRWVPGGIIVERLSLGRSYV
ncbi:hypothetical protein TCAL_16188, partial [Tigriopus californicus]